MRCLLLNGVYISSFISSSLSLRRRQIVGSKIIRLNYYFHEEILHLERYTFTDMRLYSRPDTVATPRWRDYYQLTGMKRQSGAQVYLSVPFLISLLEEPFVCGPNTSATIHSLCRWDTFPNYPIDTFNTWKFAHRFSNIWLEPVLQSDSDRLTS